MAVRNPFHEINRTIFKAVDYYKNDNKDDCGKVYLIKEKLQTGLYYIHTEEKEPHNVVFDRVPKDYVEQRFYKTTSSNIDFVNSLKINKEMLLSGFSKLSDDISMTQTERNFLFNFIKKIAPRKIMEFSPFHGFSTIAIASALKEIDVQPLFFETHEIDKENVAITNFNLYENNVEGVKVIEGDVFETLDKEKLKEVDFLMIDSDHSGGFAKRYIDEFFSLLKDGCWVAIHDISCGWYFRSKEAMEVLQYLEQNNINTFFHIADLLKIYQVVDPDDYVWSNARNTLLFWKVKK